MPVHGKPKAVPALLKRAVLVAAAALFVAPASAAGIDSRAYRCGDLQTLIGAHGFLFISAATFGDFVVANRSFCQADDRLQTRSVATADYPECLVNYCVPRTTGLEN